MNHDVQAGFEILTAVVMKPPIFWNITPGSPLEAWKVLLAICFMLDLVYSSTLKMEAKCSSEISSDFHHIVTCTGDYRHGFGYVNRFIGYSQVITIISSYTFKITVIIRINKVFYICLH
jgi:hypothetical protein